MLAHLRQDELRASGGAVGLRATGGGLPLPIWLPIVALPGAMVGGFVGWGLFNAPLTGALVGGAALATFVLKYGAG